MVDANGPERGAAANLRHAIEFVSYWGITAPSASADARCRRRSLGLESLAEEAWFSTRSLGQAFELHLAEFDGVAFGLE
jgi:hypothetical protein